MRNGLIGCPGIWGKINTNQTVWADSAYRSDTISQALTRKNIVNRIHYRPWHSAALPEWQRQTNQRRSTIRARVEHVFGHQATSMRMTVIRGIGLARATFRIGLANLVYNMSRVAQLEKMAA